MTEHREQIPFFGSQKTPEFSNFVNCGSVTLSVDNPEDFLTLAAEQTYQRSVEPTIHTTLFSKEFGYREAGNVTHASLSMYCEPDGTFILDGSVRHCHRIVELQEFSSLFMSTLQRQHALTADHVEICYSSPYTASYEVATDNGAIVVESKKKINPYKHLSAGGRDNSVRIAANMNTSSAPERVMDMLKLWARVIDILSGSVLGQRHTAPREGMVIDIKPATYSDAALAVLTQLEEYQRDVELDDSGITLPLIDFSEIHLETIAREFSDDRSHLSVALAAHALSAVRTYGRTGIMLPVTTQRLMDASRQIRDAQDY